MGNRRDGLRRPNPKAAMAALLLVLVAGGAAVACTSRNTNSAAQEAAVSSAGSSYGADAQPPNAGDSAGDQASAAASSAAGPSGAPANSGSTAGAAGGGDGKSRDGANKGGAGSGPVPQSPPPALDGRDIIRTANFAIEVTVPKSGDTDAAVERDTAALVAKVGELTTKARAAATATGGFVSASEGSATTQSITMRVPVARYDAARTALAGLGTLTGTETSEDVTGSLADMDGRITTMRAGIVRVRQLLAKATRIDDVIAIESELTQRESDLEALLGKRAALADQAALSTITLVVTGSIAPPVAGGQGKDGALLPASTMMISGPSGFTGGVLGALDVIAAIARGIGVLLGVALPFIPLVVVGWIGWQWWRKRGRAAVAVRADHR